MPAAERADQPLLRLPCAAAQPPAGTARRLDDLVHPLVAQAEAGGKLAQGRALQMEPADGPVEVGPGHLGVAFGVDQPLLGADGFGQKLGVHLSTVTRQWTADKGRLAGQAGVLRSQDLDGGGADASGEAGDLAHLVHRVQGGDLVGLGQGRVVEDRVDEIVDRAAAAHHGLEQRAGIQ